MNLDSLGMADEYDEAVARVRRCLVDWPEDEWSISLWEVKRTDAWIWPQEGVEPVPERTAETIQRFSALWCVAYHALWFLDFYSTPFDQAFASPEYVRGGPEELPFPAADGAVSVPDRVVEREPLVRYADHCRVKVAETLRRVTDEQLQAVAPTDHPQSGKTFQQVLQVSLDHVREHCAQMERVLATLR